MAVTISSPAPILSSPAATTSSPRTLSSSVRTRVQAVAGTAEAAMPAPREDRSVGERFGQLTQGRTPPAQEEIQLARAQTDGQPWRTPTPRGGEAGPRRG